MEALHLIVHNPFGPYGKGDHIRDAAEVQRVLDGPHHANVLRIAAIGDGDEGEFDKSGAADGARA